jgi:hypothetical protein
MNDNPYYPKLKAVVEAALKAFSDGRVTMSEVWMFVLVLGEAVQTIIKEGSDLSDEDLKLLKEAGLQLFDEHIEPLNLPGPDWLIDPFLRNAVIPGAIEAAFRLALSRKEPDTPDPEPDTPDPEPDDQDDGFSLVKKN